MNSKLIILDRDGVINFDSANYIKSPAEWKPIPGSLEAIARLNQAGYRVVVATNQSGVGRGLFDMYTLNAIHEKMHKALRALGGRIDAIYYCPALAQEDTFRRKPGPGMALQAKNEFPEISFSRSIMVGDSASDMEFGYRLGMKTIWIENEENGDPPAEMTSAVFPSLFHFALSILAGSHNA